MKKERRRYIHAAVTLSCCIIYAVYFYILISTLFRNGIWIAISAVNISNLAVKFIIDFCVALLFPAIILLVKRKDLYLQFSATDPVIIFLAGVYLLLFLLHADCSVSGLYAFYFYLMIVSFCEEFIFRAYLYSELSACSNVAAIVISGLLWGSMHAILPGVLSGKTFIEIMPTMLNYISSGIITGFVFIYLLKSSKTVWVPVLIHAILDYSVGAIGILVQISIVSYYLWVSYTSIKSRLTAHNSLKAVNRGRLLYGAYVSAFLSD